MSHSSAACHRQIISQILGLLFADYMHLSKSCLKKLQSSFLKLFPQKKTEK